MALLSINDPKWQTYRGGYKYPVADIVPFLKKLQTAQLAESDWEILWDDLHHQGDIGEASYAVVPYLAEYAAQAMPIAWHAFGFSAVVELARDDIRNPPLPDEVADDYKSAIQNLATIALSRGKECWGENCFEPVMGCLALSLGHRQHARAYLDLTGSELTEFYKYYYGEVRDERAN